MNSEYKSPLHQTISTTPTDFWNDSGSFKELTYAIEHGAVWGHDQSHDCYASRR